MPAQLAALHLVVDPNIEGERPAGAADCGSGSDPAGVFMCANAVK